MSLHRIFIALLFLGICRAALAAGPPVLGDYHAKGFLSDYSRLKPLDDGSGAWRYIAPAAELRRYRKVILDRIQIFLKEDADYKGIDPTALKELADYFHQAIVKALGDAYPVVSEPGPGVLHLRIAITDLVPNRPEASVISLAVPFLWMGEAGAGAVEHEPGATPFTGEVSVEMEALDSLMGKQVAAFVERHISKKYTWNKGVEKGVTDYIHAYSTWAYTKEAMDQWAKRIRVRLDEIHQGS